MNDKDYLKDMPKIKTLPPSDEPNPGSDFKPAAIQKISTLDQLKSISDPLRVDIIEILSQEALSVIQVAKRLGLPPTRLYYHVNALEEARFVTVVATRVHSGIIEKYYRTTAASFQVDQNLLSTSTAQDPNFETIFSVFFDSTLEDLKRSIKSGLISVPLEQSPRPKNLILSHIIQNIRKEDIPIFINRFQDLIEDLGVQNDEEGTVNYGCTVAFYPRTGPEKNHPPD
jgi:DNA-binding transcriptional ArsR family regulator